MKVSTHDIQALVRQIERKDLSTAAHTWRVVLYTRALTEAAGLPPELIDRLVHGAALHDVGKVDIPDAILQKPGPLTPDERGVMEKHPLLGHQRLVSMGEDDAVILNLVRHHHERLDGRGYPDRLSGDSIPAEARYFAVIDSFDALTSLRPYREAVGKEAAQLAIVEIQAGMGTHYDPKCVELFTRLYHSGTLDWILHYYNDTCDVPDFELPREGLPRR